MTYFFTLNQYGKSDKLTPSQAITILLPSQSGNSGKVLSTNGSSLQWITGGGGGGLTGSGTANEIAYFTGTTVLGSLTIATYPSLTELSYVKGLTSSAQTQLTTAKKDVKGCTVDGGGGVCSIGVIGYITIPYACTITGWSIQANGSSPTCTFDVWKISAGTALPTVANTIMGTKPALSTGNVIQSTTMTGWTTTINANDIIGFNLDSCANATRITFQLNLSLT